MEHSIASNNNDSKEPANISNKDFRMTPPLISSGDDKTQPLSPALRDLSTRFGDLDRCSLEERQRILDWAMRELEIKLSPDSKPHFKKLRTQLSLDDTGVGGHKSVFFLESKAMPAI